MNFEELQAFAGRNPILSLAFVGLTIAIVVTETALLFRRYTALKPADLTRLINSENALVVDLSPSSDFEKGHIAGSRSVVESKFDPESNKLLLSAKQSPWLWCVVMDIFLLRQPSVLRMLALRKSIGLTVVSLLGKWLKCRSSRDVPESTDFIGMESSIIRYSTHVILTACLLIPTSIYPNHFWS